MVWRLKEKNQNISAFRSFECVQRLSYPITFLVIQRSDGIFHLRDLCFIRDFLSEKQTFEKQKFAFEQFPPPPSLAPSHPPNWFSQQCSLRLWSVVLSWSMILFYKDDVKIKRLCFSFFVTQINVTSVAHQFIWMASHVVCLWMSRGPWERVKGPHQDLESLRLIDTLSVVTKRFKAWGRPKYSQWHLIYTQTGQFIWSTCSAAC